jgi:hypothetical protein
VNGNRPFAWSDRAGLAGRRSDCVRWSRVTPVADRSMQAQGSMRLKRNRETEKRMARALIFLDLGNEMSPHLEGRALWHVGLEE